MNGRERVVAAMALRKPDKVPFHAYESPEHAIRLLGREVHEMYLEPELLPNAMVHAAKLYCNDLVMMRPITGPPPGTEALVNPEGGILFKDRGNGEIVGHVERDSKTIVFHDNYRPQKQWARKIRSPRDIPDAMPITSAAEFAEEPDIRRTLAIYRDALGADRFLLGWGSGQTANILSTVLGESEAMIAALEDPGLCRAIMERRFEWLKEYYLFQSRMGIEAVYTGDAYASCSLYSPMTYRELFFEFHKKSIDYIHSLGMKALLHICGKINDILEDMADTGADVIESLDRPSSGGDVTLTDAKRRVGHRVCLKGNLDAVHEIAPGPPERIYELCLQAMRDAGPEGYILSTEQITRDTPSEHVSAMVQARDDFSNI